MIFPDSGPIVACDRYPIDDLTASAGHDLVQRCRGDYAHSGVCALPDFLFADALSSLVTEVQAVVDHAWVCESQHTAWLKNPVEASSDTPAFRHAQTTRVGSVAADWFGPESLLRQLYLWPPLVAFIAAVLERPKLYPFADPLGSCTVNVFGSNGVHGWHFDEAEFTITLMLQAPESGGEFEYVPSSIARRDSPGSVYPILSGERDSVVRLPFTPGTLLIFSGRNTLHRVSDVAGETPRLVPVLCYADQPGVVNSEAVRELFWGRTA